MLQAAGCFELPKFIYHINSSRGTQDEHSVCYITVPPCQNRPEEFISNFTNETAYYSLQAVLSDGKFIYPIHSSRGTQYKHNVCYPTMPLCQNWPEEFLSNFTNETAYYSLQAVLSSGKSIYPIHSSRGTQYEHAVCCTTVPRCQNWPEEFLSNFTNETEYYRLQAVLSTGKCIPPIPSSRGTQYEHSVCYTTVPPSPNWPEAFISNFTNETAYYSLQAVLSSQSPFTPSTRPAGHGMSTLYAIRQCRHARIGPRNFFPIL